MEYTSIREEELPDYAKKFTWILLHAYIYAHSQILSDEYPRYGVKAL